MKVKLKFLVLCAVLVSVAFSSVAFFCVRSNAEGSYIDNYTTANLDEYYSCLNPLNTSTLWKCKAVNSHKRDFHVSGNSSDFVDNGLHLLNKATTATGTETFRQGHGFTIELVIGDYMPGPGGGSKKSCNLFSLNGATNGAKFSIATIPSIDNTIAVGYQQDSSKNLYTGGTWSYGSDSNDKNYDKKLKNCTLSVVFDVTNKKVSIYYNGDLVHQSSDTNITHFDDLLSGGSIQLGDGGDWKCSVTYKALRFYYEPISSDDIANNWKVDKQLYFGSAPEVKPTHSYGITGLNKILEQAKIGSETKTNLLYTSVKDINKDYKEIFTNAKGEYELSNELLEDWELSTNLEDSAIAKMYYDPNDTTYEFWPNQAPTGVSSARATFVNVGKTAPNSSSVTYSKSTFGRIDHILAARGISEYNNVDENTALLIEKSFFLRGKYKCGTGEVKRNSDGSLDSVNTTKLMVTADICPATLNDTDFCGMVIDFSDEYYNKYSPDSISMYTNEMGKDHNGNNKKYKYENNAWRLSGGITGYTTSLFPTGVGFNLFRKDNTSANNGYDENDGYRMRVFVGGTDSSTATFTDIDFTGLNLTGYGTDTDEGLDYLQSSPNSATAKTFHNFTIYRTYEYWPYDTVAVYDFNDGRHMYITKDTSLVYMVKFYVDKMPVALVAMEVTEKLGNDGIDRCLKNRGAIFKMQYQNGKYVPVLDYYDQNLNHYTSASNFPKKQGQVKTFGDWSAKNLYGENGKVLVNKMSGGDTIAEADYTALGLTSQTENLRNVGTPSGNILIAVHKIDENLDGDAYYKIQWFDTNANAYSHQNENDFCKIYMDNIGYMDYHNHEKTISTFMGQLNISESMTFNIDSTMKFTWPTEPIIQFNRLNYTYSDDMDIDPSTLSGQALLDYNASHGYAQIHEVPNKTNSRLDQHYKSVDGVYYKDIYDLITYKFTDFNGESMFTTKLRVWDYLETLFTYYNDNPELDPVRSEQNKYNFRSFLKDLVEVCKAMQIYSGYINHSEEIPYLTYNGEECPGAKYSGIGIQGGFGPDAPEGKAKLVKSDASHTYTNKISSINAGFSNYFSLIFKLTVSNSVKNNLNNYLSIELNGEQLDFETDIETINHYTNHLITKVLSNDDNGDGTSTVYIEIPVPISDITKRFKVILKDVDTAYDMYIEYALMDYCCNKWNTTSNLQQVVRRLKRLYFAYTQLSDSFKSRYDWYLEGAYI